MVMMVSRCLVDLRHHVIRWPDNQGLQAMADSFAERCNFPGVVGAVDGTHVPILGPSEDPAAYINRKGRPSIQLQAVCDKQLLFIDVYTGWPGSVHDSRVFFNSPLRMKLENGILPVQYHLLGDSAYQLKNYLMVPFRDNGHLTALQRNFNTKHSSTRIEIERAFGLLKGKFRRLKELEMTKVEDIPIIIFACCVLHNFIILDSGIDEMDIDLDDDIIVGDVVDPFYNGQHIPDANAKRLHIVHQL